MKTLFQIVLTYVLGVSTVGVLVACDPNGPSGRSGAAKDADGRGSSNPLDVDGTSDSGGGTGVNGKVFESYIIDPTTLPAFQKFVKPLLENIKSDLPKTEKGSYLELYRMKTWYLAPVKLESVKKNLLGISFVESETQQIARQTSTAIWIDSRLFNSMELKDQADLLLHEIVMNLYLAKFLKFNDLCKAADRLADKDSKQSCEGDIEKFDKMFPPEEAKPLDENDNENIRFATSWLLKKAQNSIKEIEFIEMLSKNGFDQRIFNPKNYLPENVDPKELTLTPEELLENFNGSIMAGSSPNVCTAYNLASAESCEVSAGQSTVDTGYGQLPAIELKVAIKGHSTISLYAFASEGKFALTEQENHDGKYFSLSAAGFKSKFKVGDLVYSGFIFFKSQSLGDKEVLVLDSIVIKTQLITSIDKKKSPICTVREPKAKTLLEDTIVISQEGASSNVIQGIFANVYIDFQICTEKNVE